MQLCGSSADGSGSITGTIGGTPIGVLGEVGSTPSGFILGCVGGSGSAGAAGAAGNSGSIDGGSP